jgi:phage/plasmid-like protein (TIGR03299 family)
MQSPAPPWEGLGVQVPRKLDVTKVLKDTGLEWRAVKLPLYCDIGHVKTVVPGREVLVREDDMSVLSVVSPDWTPVQNRDALEFFRDFTNKADMTISTVGTLRGGRIVWALADTDHSFQVTPDDVVDSHLLLSSPHEYGRSIDVKYVGIRRSNMSTYVVPLDLKRTHKMIDDSGVSADPNEVADAVAETHSLYEKQAQSLFSMKYDDEGAGYFKEIFSTRGGGLSKPASVAMAAMSGAPGKLIGRGTFWHAFGVASYVIDHVLGRSADTRLTSAWHGINRLKKARAMDIALKKTGGQATKRTVTHTTRLT